MSKFALISALTAGMLSATRSVGAIIRLYGGERVGPIVDLLLTGVSNPSYRPTLCLTTLTTCLRESSLYVRLVG